jgi:hypothetical protein
VSSRAKARRSPQGIAVNYRQHFIGIISKYWQVKVRKYGKLKVIFSILKESVMFDNFRIAKYRITIEAGESTRTSGHK